MRMLGSCSPRVLFASGLLILLPGAELFAAVSQPIGKVLREPLPPEELLVSTNAENWTVSGPTFAYVISRESGVIQGASVKPPQAGVLSHSGPMQVKLDDLVWLAPSTGSTRILNATRGKVEVYSDFCMGNSNDRTTDVNCTVLHTIYNDGVLVSKIVLKPGKDLLIQNQLACKIETGGQFSHWLHKRRDEHGGDAVRGALPQAGDVVRHDTLTSCLQVFSPSAGLALFTDSGAAHLSKPGLHTATIAVKSRKQDGAELSMEQYVIRIAPGDKPFLIKAGEEFAFRAGLSLTPNRIPHRRMHDLRMFAWIGDPKYPYPTDREITDIAAAGYTVMQMHRLGTPGEPREPQGELARMINKVHETGMLFLWTENADLMYDIAPGVQEMKKKGKFALWQGFNYGGRYKASMDPYCDLIATCLASPNGLDEYRMQTYRRMMDRFDVDGIYLDDNLAYGNCTLWKEHGHPHPVYDCLIELHEMNWKRRQFLRERCPHTVIVSHNTRAIVLPVVCDFDALLYGEGYSFDSMQNYWDYYRPVNGIPSQGMIWPGGQDPVRCPAALAYNYDLTTGGGQYCQIDWRWYPEKFSYGAGVTDAERVYVRTYNIAQYNFGVYESKPFYFAESTNLFSTSAPQTFASIYHNAVWNEWLLAVANMSRQPQTTALKIRDPEELGLGKGQFTLFDTHKRSRRFVKTEDLGAALGAINLQEEGLGLYLLRPLPAEGAYHLWGGKRLEQTWNAATRTLRVTLQGPEGLKETVFFGAVSGSIEKVLVSGSPAEFYFDPSQGLAHGTVPFTTGPIVIEVVCSKEGKSALPVSPVRAAPIAALLKQ